LAHGFGSIRVGLWVWGLAFSEKFFVVG
jgi:hypothetical protein